jgi:hypothetical protein
MKQKMLWCKIIFQTSVEYIEGDKGPTFIYTYYKFIRIVLLF